MTAGAVYARFFENALHEFTIEAWGDTFKTWQYEFHKKHEADTPELSSETLEGAELIANAARRAKGTQDGDRLQELSRRVKAASPKEVDAIARLTELEALMATWAGRADSTQYTPYPLVRVDRERAASRGVV